MQFAQQMMDQMQKEKEELMNELLEANKKATALGEENYLLTAKVNELEQQLKH